jgi:hypothetical protein
MNDVGWTSASRCSKGEEMLGNTAPRCAWGVAAALVLLCLAACHPQTTAANVVTWWQIPDVSGASTEIARRCSAASEGR